MNRFASLSAAASLIAGGLLFVGCQSPNDNRNPNDGAAQTSGDVYNGTYDNTQRVERSDGTRSDAADRNNEQGRGLTSSNMETHGGPSRITGGENVDHNGLGINGSSAGTLNNSDLTGQRSNDASVPATQPSDVPPTNVPTTQPSVILSQ